MSEKESMSFEDALARLEVIVDKLEDDSIMLDKSIELYEEGIELSKYCTETLEEAELRIEKVTEESANESKEDS